ncbi:MAG: flagellar motor switch protein FliN [Ignavibacteriae bacterium]|nr:flagellar motor switch protein FliN [Ignavibacteriota bacterium]NOG97147.1 flagellar motor switch protein FliN [Ignavibacteriota bacterium]
MTENEESKKSEAAAEETKKPADAVENTPEESVQAGDAEFENFDESFNFNSETLNKLDYLNDLQLNIYIELGRTRMKIKDILELERGYVIELDKLASEPVDIFVNNKKIAEGEVVVIDKHFGIRIVNLVDPKKMMQGIS